MSTKRPGRPPLDANDYSVRVGVSLPSKQFDELCRQAIRQEVSVPEIVRRLICANSDYAKKSKK